MRWFVYIYFLTITFLFCCYNLYLFLYKNNKYKLNVKVKSAILRFFQKDNIHKLIAFWACFILFTPAYAVYVLWHLPLFLLSLFWYTCRALISYALHLPFNLDFFKYEKKIFQREKFNAWKGVFWLRKVMQRLYFLLFLLPKTWALYNVNLLIWKVRLKQKSIDIYTYMKAVSVLTVLSYPLWFLTVVNDSTYSIVIRIQNTEWKSKNKSRWLPIGCHIIFDSIRTNLMYSLDEKITQISNENTKIQFK